MLTGKLVYMEKNNGTGNLSIQKNKNKNKITRNVTQENLISFTSLYNNKIYRKIIKGKTIAFSFEKKAKQIKQKANTYKVFLLNKQFIFSKRITKFSAIKENIVSNKSALKQIALTTSVCIGCKEKNNAAIKGNTLLFIFKR